MFGVKIYFRIIIISILFFLIPGLCLAEDIKYPNVAGIFYPIDPKQLSELIDELTDGANPQTLQGDIFALISPHAGYEFSGQVAAFAYKLIKGKSYKTVIVIGTSHYYGFEGISVYPEGIFNTPLGNLEIDKEFTKQLLNKDPNIAFEPAAFAKEHSVEVELPFLQKVLGNFKIVPIITGDTSFSTCQKLANLLKAAIGERKDVLVVASTDMYHGFDFDEADIIDNLTLTYIKDMNAEGLYKGLRDGKLQLCGGFGVVSTILLSKELKHNTAVVLEHTNSAIVTARKVKGLWTVGYASIAIDQDKAAKGLDKEAPKYIGVFGAHKLWESNMLNNTQRKRLLEIARNSIKTYLETGKKSEIKETDLVLLKEMGAFVTLTEHGELRGCIGNLVGSKPLYLTIRDMAVEAAVSDPRFSKVRPEELKNIEIEISVLSPMEKIDDPGKIKMGVHGVLVRRDFRSGVFLPQVATETGWSKEEFMNNLCAHKAGLAPDAWKDKSTEIYIFSAEVFSEKETLSNE